MKILILSPYTNHLLREHLEFKQYNLFLKWIIDKLGLTKNTSFKDIAPWVGQFIADCESCSDLELFSVSPHVNLKHQIESFSLGKTKYYFYSSEYSSALRLLKNYKLWKMLQNSGRLVNSIAKEINPDIVLSFGTENPVNSYAAIGLSKKYPVLIVLQTIYNNPDRIKYTIPNRLIQQLEMDIVNHIHYYGTEYCFYTNLLKAMNSDAKVLRFIYPVKSFPKIPYVEKQFDFVNFAYNMDYRKGDEDSIRALAIVKEKYPNVLLNLAGGAHPDRRKHMVELTNELGLSDNVIFTDMFECKEDMYKQILLSKFAVLPVKMDLLSTTMKEAMNYKLPLITNITPETPNLNLGKQRVLLAEKDNIKSLADCMLKFMEDCEYAHQLASNAFEYIQNEMNDEVRAKNNTSVIKSVIDNYHNKTELPSSLLMCR